MAKPLDNINLPPKVATDRYRKRLRDEDLNRGEANYAKSAIAGSLAGLALKFKGKSRGERAALGAAAGIAAQAVVRRAGAGTKDFYGERSRTAKKSEKLPVVAGLATAGILARRRLKGLEVVNQNRVEFSISPALKRKLTHGAALAGGIAIADSATHASFPDKDMSRKKAAASGLAQGAVYGSVLAGVEPQLVAKIRRYFSRPIGPIATGIPEAPFYFIRNVDPAEDLRAQRRKLAVLGGGVVAGAVGLGLLARSGSRGRVAADLAQSFKKMPPGRGTLARVAEANALKTERGYVHLKPMASGQRKRFDKLAPAVQTRAGEIAAHNKNPNFSPEERRRARKMLGAFRSQHNFSSFIKDAGVESALRKLTENLRSRGAGLVLPRRKGLNYNEAEKRLAKRMLPAKLPPQKRSGPDVRMFGMNPAAAEAPQLVVVRKSKTERVREEREHKLRVAAGVAGIGAGVAVTGTAAAKLGNWAGRNRTSLKLLKGAFKLGKVRGALGQRIGFEDERLMILFKRQQLREKEGDRFADPLYAASTGQHVYAHTEGGERRSYGGDNAPLPLAHAQVLRAAYNKAGRVHKWGGRVLSTASDVGDVIGGRPRKVDYAGRPKKREWEKPYAKRVAETAALGAGVLGGALILKKNPRLRAKVLGGAARVREKVNRSFPDFFASRKFTAPVHELAIRFREHGFAGQMHYLAREMNFDDLANYAGWDVRDPRGRSARVFAPGSRKRMRREKEWHETADGQRKIRNALIAATAVAAGGAGLLAGRHLPKKTVQSVASNIIKLPVRKT